MTKILKGTMALFLLISGAFYKYDYDITALVFLCLGVALSLAILFSIRKDVNKPKDKEKIKLHEFTFIDPPGYYTHPKYPDQKICPSCLIKEQRPSPVSKVDENAWYCNVCNKPLSGSLGAVFTIPD
ncbi:MAG: hypothetical protein KAV45_08275 [Calditrichia bacterium]|nr:hypothetical protein [Calditrichia bacterium]